MYKSLWIVLKTKNIVPLTLKNIRNEKGESNVELKFQTGWQTHGHLQPMVNTQQYGNIYNAAANNDNPYLPSFVKKAIIGASLAGIDKSNQNGKNWVTTVKDFFNSERWPCGK